MSTAAETSNSGFNEDVGAGFEGMFDEIADGEDVSIDMDAFFNILEETPDPSQSNTLYQSAETAHECGLATGIEDYDKSMCQRDELNLSFSGGSENSNETMEISRKHPLYPAEISLIEANQVSTSGTCFQSGVSHVPETDYIASMGQSWSEGKDVNDLMTLTLPFNANMLNNEKNEIGNLQPFLSNLNQSALPGSELQSTAKSIIDNPTIDFLGQSAPVQGLKNECFFNNSAAMQDTKSGYFFYPPGVNFFGGNTYTTGAASEHFMLETHLAKKEETAAEFLFPSAMNYHLGEEAENKDFSQTSFAYVDGNLGDNMFPGKQSLAVTKMEDYEVCLSNRLHPSQDLYDNYTHPSLESARNSFHASGGLDSLQQSFVKNELNTNFVSMSVKSSGLQPEGCQFDSPYCGRDADGLYILEDVNQQPAQIFPVLSSQSGTTMNQLPPRTPENDVNQNAGVSKLMPHDERPVRRAALRIERSSSLCYLVKAFALSDVPQSAFMSVIDTLIVLS